MTIVTVFRSRLRPGVDDAYGDVAQEMRRLVHEMDGFVEETFCTSLDGERVTIVRFRDRESQRAWAERPEHVAAQRRGRDEFYSWYDISVSEETYQHSFVATESLKDTR
ncbi:MAG: antibiotic biosynthesis monooxygenase family protein [Acidimicrobiales bacterium]